MTPPSVGSVRSDAFFQIGEEVAEVLGGEHVGEAVGHDGSGQGGGGRDFGRGDGEASAGGDLQGDGAIGAADEVHADVGGAFRGFDDVCLESGREGP